MSATTLTQTTIKTQSVTGFRHHQPLLVTAPCINDIIPSPAVEHHRRPLRCSARLISQSNSDTALLSAAPIATKPKRRRPASKHCTSSTAHPLTVLPIGHSGPSLPSGDALPSSDAPPIDPPDAPVLEKPFPSLLPLQVVSPVADKLSPQPCNLSFSPRLPKLPLLSFPQTPILPHPVFHFPLAIPARHLPPPHPGPRPLTFPPSLPHPTPDHHHHNRLPINYFPQSFPFCSSDFQSYWPRSKRPAPLHPEHHLRSKKIKLHHSFFRSTQVLYPLDYSLKTPTNSSKMTSSPKSIGNPTWLHTSPAAQGQPSKMRPDESQWTGNPANWISNKSLSFTPRVSSSAASPPRIVPPVKQQSHRLPQQPAYTGGSQAAPLKAQLLAVLRMRSSLQPGEAALRLKKWVIWNSWVRGRGQMRVYPIVDPQQSNPRIIPPSPSRPPSRTGRSASEDEWTGDEMFDDNGDLICEEEEQEDEEQMKAAEERKQWALRQEARSASSSSGSSVPRKSQTIIRLKIPPRTTSTQFSLQPTPPASPVSLTHTGQATFSQKDATVPGPSSPPDSQTQAATQSPLTPPPSPPNAHPR